MWSKSGQIYIGNYLNGNKHGKGKITWPDGRINTTENEID